MNSIVKPISEGEIGHPHMVRESADQVMMSKAIRDNMLQQTGRTEEEYQQRVHEMFEGHREAIKNPKEYFKNRVDLFAYKENGVTLPTGFSVSTGNYNGKKNGKRKK